MGETALHERVRFLSGPRAAPRFDGTGGMTLGDGRAQRRGGRERADDVAVPQHRREVGPGGIEQLEGGAAVGELLGVEILGASALLSQATIEELQQLEP